MHACNVAFSETFVLRSKPHWLHSELLKHWLHSPKDALSTFFTAPHTFPELYCETWLLRQGSVPRVCGIVQKVEKAFVVFFQSCLSAVFVLILRGEEGTIRVAEVGRLSAKAKNAFNSFVGRVFPNLRLKTLFLNVLPKSQQKHNFLHVLLQIQGNIVFLIFLNA